MGVDVVDPGCDHVGSQDGTRHPRNRGESSEEYDPGSDEALLLPTRACVWVWEQTVDVVIELAGMEVAPRWRWGPLVCPCCDPIR